MLAPGVGASQAQPAQGSDTVMISMLAINARIGEHVGQRNLAVAANTYTHVLADETELDYQRMLR